MEAATISKRHHYIPRFLIDNFADTDNKVWVYDKNKGEIIKNKRSSKSIFFEMDRNNFEVDGKKTDDIEQMYGAVDDMFSKNLEKVLSTQSMTGTELTMLIALVTFIKWRIPASDEDFNKNFKNIPIEQLGAAIRPIDRDKEIDDEKVEKIKEMDIAKEVNRFLLPLQPLIREKNLDDIHKNCFLLSSSEIRVYRQQQSSCPCHMRCR